MEDWERSSDEELRNACSILVGKCTGKEVNWKNLEGGA
jgi:hypothetical protein